MYRILFEGRAPPTVSSLDLLACPMLDDIILVVYDTLRRKLRT